MVKRIRLDDAEEVPKAEKKYVPTKTRVPAVKEDTVRWTARAARDWAYATGELPHMFLLRVARGEAVKPGGGKPTFEEQLDAAKSCAGYFAPKLSSVQLSDREERDPPQELVFDETVLESLNDAELAIFQKVFGKLIGRVRPGEGEDNAAKAKTENRYTSTLDLSAEPVATKPRSG